MAFHHNRISKHFQKKASLKVLFSLRGRFENISVSSHVGSIYANLTEQKKVFTEENSSTPTGFIWNTNMASVSLFWDINMADVTS